MSFRVLPKTPKIFDRVTFSGYFSSKGFRSHYLQFAENSKQATARRCPLQRSSRALVCHWSSVPHDSLSNSSVIDMGTTVRTKPHGIPTTTSPEIKLTAARAAQQRTAPGIWCESIAAALRTERNGGVLEVLLACRTDQRRLQKTREHKDAKKITEPNHPISLHVIDHRKKSREGKHQH